MSSKKLLFLVITSFTCFFYYPIFKYGFSQDDFIHLSASSAKTIYQVLNFFNPFAAFPDIFFYRPLTTQFYFFINMMLGQNPLIFHLEALSLHIINSFLFFHLTKMIWKDFRIAAISSILYSISAIHFLSLFYISAFQQIGQMFFILLSMIYFVDSQIKQRKYSYQFSLLFFILSLLSKETSIVLPILIFTVEMIINSNFNLQSAKKLALKLTPFLFIIFAYLTIRLFAIQTIFKEGSYSFSLTIFQLIQNIKWYILWIFGLPEVISTYPSISISQAIQFANDYPESKFILGLFILLVFGVSGGLLKNASKSKRLFLLCFVFTVTSLAPVLFLTEHKYPHYLDKSLIVLLPTMVVALFEFDKRRYLLTGVLAVFIALQFFSIRLTERIHWTTHRADIANYYIQKLQLLNFDEKKTVVFLGEEFQTKEVSYALAYGYALKVYFPCEIENIIYTKTTTEKIPLNSIIISTDKF